MERTMGGNDCMTGVLFCLGLVWGLWSWKVLFFECINSLQVSTAVLSEAMIICQYSSVAPFFPLPLSPSFLASFLLAISKDKG